MHHLLTIGIHSHSLIIKMKTKIKKEIQELEDFLKMEMWYQEFKTKKEMNYYLMLNFRNLKHRIENLK